MATQAAVGIQLNEEKLIRAGQRGDEQAVEALFRRYQRPLFQTALRVLGNTEDAEDALQDGLLSAYRKGASGGLAGRNAARGRAACRGALRGRRADSGAGFCEHRDSRDDQRKSGRALAAAADGVRPARSAGLLDGRGG